MTGVLSSLLAPKGPYDPAPAQPVLPQQGGGLLSKLFGGLNTVSDELLNPTSGLGKLGAYLGAAGGSDLGLAAMAAMKDQRASGDADLERQYKQAQIQKILNPPPANNDTANDYEFYKQRFGPDFADKWLKNNAEKPVAVQMTDPATNEVKTFFVTPSMIGGIAGGAAPAKTAPAGVTFTPIEEGGQTAKPSGGFR